MDGALTRPASWAIRSSIEEPIVGDARESGPLLLAKARGLAERLPRPSCVIASGETTVKVLGSGKGGRNQEMALAVARALAGAPGETVFASLGTDGIDGPTDAAGAFFDTTTLARATSQGRDPDAYLADNNAYAFFGALDDLIMTGPTTTNVGDVQIVLLR